jgi:replication factor C subunit 1
MSDNWYDKYRPTKSDEIIGNKKALASLKDFLKTFHKKNSNVIISGNHGIGKTLMVDIVLAEMGFVKVVPNFAAISNKKMNSIKKYYIMLSNRKDIGNLDAFNVEKVALVIDEIDMITGTNEKEGIKMLHKLNDKYKNLPLIIITNPRHNKIVNYLKKNSAEIIMQQPEYDELHKFIRRIGSQEGISFSKDRDDDVIDEIMIHSQYDIRRLIGILHELKHIYGDTIMDNETFIDYSETAKTKDIDLSIYEAGRKLLNDYGNIHSCLEMYELDRSAIPLIFHENYLSNIQIQYKKISAMDKISLIHEISKNLSTGDIVDGFIYSNSAWDLQIVHGYYTCVIPAFLINQLPHKQKNRETYLYTKDFNKTSIRKINCKVIAKTQANPYMKNMSIFDFLHINNILKTLIEEEKYGNIRDLLSAYNLQEEQIESLLKIDKIKMTKNNLTAKQKKDMFNVFHQTK